MDPQPVQPAQDLQQQVVERIKDATNILVTVSNNPSVDQLAAAIGFTLVLNKLKKHGTAVFSGKVPSIIEFLEPEKTLEKDTSSLRDFIIALDKAKADKLRYKIEDKYVKIFITPYRTSITDKDLEFSQGDFNVEVVIALGVKKQEDLDQAIAAHGRILHDATVIAINKQPGSELGNLNLTASEASSLSEIMVAVSQRLKGEQTDHLFDQQIATAFLTGIVAETKRFSNDKTTPETMKAASILMEAGANQQLIATKLEPPAAPKPAPLPPPPPAPEPIALKTQPAPLQQPAPPAPAVPEAPEPQPPAGPSSETPLAPLSHNTPKPLPAAEKPQEATTSNDGSLSIPHGETSLVDLAAETEEEKEAPIEEIHIDDQGTLQRMEEIKQAEAAAAAAAAEPIAAAAEPAPAEPVPVTDTLPSIIKQSTEPLPDIIKQSAGRHILETSDRNDNLNANTEPAGPDGDGLTLPPPEQPLLHHDAPTNGAGEPAAAPTEELDTAPSAPLPPANDEDSGPKPPPVPPPLTPPNIQDTAL